MSKRPPRRRATAAFLRIALSTPIVTNALEVSAVVGTVLNLINQGGALWAGEAVSWPHVALNYLVPYCVATYSAARNQLRGSAYPDTRVPNERDCQ